MYPGLPASERKERVEEALRVGADAGISRRSFPAVSSSAWPWRALATHPSLLLADEPTGNLDSKTGAEIMSLFHELHSGGNTIVLITHDNSVAKQAERRIQERTCNGGGLNALAVC